MLPWYETTCFFPLIAPIRQSIMRNHKKHPFRQQEVRVFWLGGQEEVGHQRKNAGLGLADSS